MPSTRGFGGYCDFILASSQPLVQLGLLTGVVADSRPIANLRA